MVTIKAIEEKLVEYGYKPRWEKRGPLWRFYACNAIWSQEKTRHAAAVRVQKLVFENDD
jgi:hypothetical protein